MTSDKKPQATHLDIDIPNVNENSLDYLDLRLSNSIRERLRSEFTFLLRLFGIGIALLGTVMAFGFNTLLDWKIEKLLKPQRVNFESEINTIKDNSEEMLLAIAIFNYIEERLSSDNQRYYHIILAYKSLIKNDSFTTILKKTEISKLLWPVLDGERRVHSYYQAVDPVLIEKELSDIETNLVDKDEMKLIRNMMATLVFSTRHMLALNKTTTKAKELIFVNAKINKDRLRVLYDDYIFPAYKAGMDEYKFSGTRGGDINMFIGGGNNVNSLMPDANLEFDFYMQHWSRLFKKP